MSKLTFRVYTRASGRKRGISVMIYDTQSQLRNDALRFSQLGGEDITQERFYCITQSYQHWDVDEDGNIKHLPAAGVIRFMEGGLRMGIITHECSHMALKIYQQDVGKMYTLGDVNAEETYCYLVGDIASKVVSGIYRHGTIKEVE